MELFSTEFWVLVQMIITLALVVLMIICLKSVNSGQRPRQVVQYDNRAEKAAEQVVAMLEPLLREADASASAFEELMREKKELIRILNEKLDNRIISLNLLLNRAEASFPKTVSPGMDMAAGEKVKIHEIQDAIIKLHEKGLDTESIASTLAVTGSEVEMVIDLKKKFRAMEG